MHFLVLFVLIVLVLGGGTYFISKRYFQLSILLSTCIALMLSVLVSIKCYTTFLAWIAISSNFKKAIVEAHKDDPVSQDSQLLFTHYLESVQTKIKSSWHPPCNKVSKTTVLKFTLDKNGRVINISTLQSSGNDKLDQSAYQAIYDAAPFGHFPKQAKTSKINVEFTFDYNVLHRQKSRTQK